MYVIKYDGKYVTELRFGYWDGEYSDTYHQEYWIDKEVHINYAMEFETLEGAESMLQEICEKVDYVTYSELEIEEVV